MGFSLAHRKDVKPRFKYQVIYQHRDEHHVLVMCQFFGVSRIGYYSYVTQLGRIEKDLLLAERIKEQQIKCHQTYGYRRMHLWLKSQGIYLKPQNSTKNYEKVRDSVRAPQKKEVAEPWLADQ